MKLSTILTMAAAATIARAHTTIYAVFVNDVDQGRGDSASGYIRSPPSNSPITDVKSQDMTCNVNNSPAAKTLKVKAGDKITFEWHHNNRDASDDIVDPSHKGPVITYIAPTASNGKGNVWVKLAEEGFTNGKWAVENLIANRGKHSITVPDVRAGQYLLRPEIIALHEGFNVGGAQFYMGCVQVEVTSAGSKTLPAGVAIPGAYSAQDAGIHRNIYPMTGAYKVPGPPVWNGASGGAGGAPAPPAPVPTTLVQVPVPAPTQAPSPPSNPPSNPPSSPPPSAGGAIPEWGQCGGNNYRGSTRCAPGLTCKRFHEWYSQCLRQ